MLYLPKRAAFIHIPRTGGHSVKSAISNVCLRHNIPVVASTIPGWIKQYDRVEIHQRGVNLKGYIREWKDIYRFTIHRSVEDRIKSAIKWVEHLRSTDFHKNPNTAEEMKEFIGRDDYIDNIRDTWTPYTTQFFTEGDYGEDLGVEVYKFEELNDRWHEICDKCQIPRCELPHLNTNR